MRLLFRAIAAAVRCWWDFVCGRITCGKLKADDGHSLGSDLAPSCKAGAVEFPGQPPDQQVEDGASPPEFDPKLHAESGSTQEANDLVRTGTLAAEHHAERHEERGGERSGDAASESDAVGEQVDGPGASTGVGGQSYSFPAHVEPVVDKADGQGVHQAAEPARRADEEAIAVADGPRGSPSGPEGELQKVPGRDQVDDARGDQVAQADSTSGDAEGSGAGAGNSSLSAESPSDVAAPVPTTPTHNREQQRRPPKYREPAGGPSAPPQPSRPTTNASTSPSRGLPAPIEVRVLFERGGHCTVSLLAKRPPRLPDELTVSSDIGEVELVALEDGWYQDVVPENLGHLLRAGFVWTDKGSGQEWLLSGREVFVLAPSSTHRGYVSCPRLVLGREHVVLCSISELPAVEEVLRETRCPAWTQLVETDGAPAGWVVLRGIVPQRPVRPSSDADILNVLRPLPEIEIALEGGIRLAYNSWLIGHPPAIRVYGDPEHTEKVRIDGQDAVGSNDHGYTAPGWDEEGHHQTWCNNTNKSYSLVRCEASWRFWPAYSFSLPGSKDRVSQFAFCGPLVRPAGAPHEIDSNSGQRGAIQVPLSNPVLLGSRPGQVFVAHRRRDVRAAQCLVSPPFDPVWALPAQPLLCDKRANRILLVGEPVAVCGGEDYGQPPGGRRVLERWYRFILDCSRKGLAVDPANQATYQLWREYKRYARRLWRRMR